MMAYDKNRVFKNYVNTPGFSEKVELGDVSLKDVEMHNQTNNKFVEALKVIIRSHSENQTKSVAIRKVNSKIQNMSGGS